MRSTSVILLTLLLLFILEYYSYVAVRIATRKSSSKTRAIIIAIYLTLTILSLIIAVSFRHMNYQEWNPVIKTISISFIMGFMFGKLIMVLFMLVDDLRRIITWVFKKITNSLPKKRAAQSLEEQVQVNQISRSTFITNTGILIGSLFFGGFLIGTQNKYRYRIKREKIKLRNLPSSFKGLKIVQISDVHAGSFDDKEAVEKGIDLILAEQPDIIVITGDLVNNKSDEMIPYLDIFSKLKAPMGVYSILGNHDYGDYAVWDSEEDKAKNLEDLCRYQKEMGWTLLRNEHVVFEKSGEKIALLGVENWSNKAHFPKLGDLGLATQGLGNDIKSKILLTHDPSHWDGEIKEKYPDIDLALSGHTHGMQFGIRLPFMKWSPSQYIYKQWAGLYSENNQHLYVNVGYGYLGYPGRLGIMPEITVLELV